MKALGYDVLRLRTILRFVKDARAESGLRELIADAEQRLEQLEVRRGTKASMTGSATDAPSPKRKLQHCRGLLHAQLYADSTQRPHKRPLPCLR